MPLEPLDFTGISEGYRENGKPEKLGIYTSIEHMISVIPDICENGKPEKLGIYTQIRFLLNPCNKLGENGKPEKLGIYTIIN